MSPVAQRMTRRIALIGNPNSGKTTLFNRLTGLRQKVANYPGVTVERREARMGAAEHLTLVDLPGSYSLTPRSPDQRIARDALLGWCGLERPDAVVLVIDASNLERNLFLATQVLELNLPTVIACNMIDLVRKRGDILDVDRLSRALGAPVIATVGSTGEGIEELRTAIDHVESSPARSRSWSVPDGLENATDCVRRWIERRSVVEPNMTDGVAMLLLTPSVLDADSPAFAGLPDDLREELRGIHKQHGLDNGSLDVAQVVEVRYRWIGELVRSVVLRAPPGQATITDRIDRVVMHKIAGPVVFASLMLAMFWAIFTGAAPIMDAIDSVVGIVGSAIASALGPGMLTDLLVDGVIAGVGSVVIFFPQICILFLTIALLEDSGYMARAAFVADRVMHKVGLQGRSFIPLLSSFACAVPAIMATRTIENRRDRLATMLVAPLMSCSARLPVYLVIITALFGTSVWVKTGMMFGLYALGLAAGLIVAAVLKRTMLRGPTPTFMLELPPYRMPRLGAAVRAMWDRSKLFLTQAGTVILAISVVLWALAYFPRAAESAEPGEQLRNSYMGRVGHWMEPVIEPLGFDWRIGVGLAASFAAREVFVSTMGVVYGVGDDADEESAPLREKITAATWPDGRKVFTPLVGVSLMVFFALACQCMSTIAVVRRETNSWRWPIFMFAYMTALAYAASLLVYQSGVAIGLG